MRETERFEHTSTHPSHMPQQKKKNQHIAPTTSQYSPHIVHIVFIVDTFIVDAYAICRPADTYTCKCLWVPSHHVGGG